MKVYAVPNSIEQHIGKAPSGAVLMDTERPSADHVAQADGTWVLGFAGRRRIAKQQMDDTLALGCLWNGNTYGCNLDDIDQFSRGLTLAGLMNFTECNVWDKAGNKHIVTLAEYRDLCSTIGLHYAGLFEVYKTTVGE